MTELFVRQLATLGARIRGVSSAATRRWLLGAVGAGLVLGVGVFTFAPPPVDAVLPAEPPAVVRLLSETAGWTYFVCWSVSFWPQVVLNLRRRDVDGLSVDFLVLNVCGFAAYAAFNVLLFFPTEVRSAYEEHHGSPPAVHANDVLFAVHALVMTIVSLFQSYLYDSGDGWFHRRVWPATLAFCAVGGIAVVVAVAAPCGVGGPLVLLDVLSAIKVATSMVKYAPQLAENHARSSTTGFSFSQVVLDATGSVLSVLQLLLDAIVLRSWRIVRGNPAKLLLGVVSLAYDGMLAFQHVSYGGEDIDEPLL